MAEGLPHQGLPEHGEGAGGGPSAPLYGLPEEGLEDHRYKLQFNY
jgi:hypothetical protein